MVGIGASAGGLAAFEAFFAAMPVGDETGMAFVLVQHLSPDHKSMLVELVKRCTRMQVFEASNGMVVQPNCTYIIPPNHDLELVHGTLFIKQHDRQRKPRLTIDHFFSSLAAAQGERAICVVMSGTGNDGTLGLRDVKGEGGLVIAQDPDSAEYDGMPRSAIATGMVDYVLAPAAMPGQLLSYVRHAFDAARPLAIAATRDGFLKQIVRAAARTDRPRLLAVQGNHAAAARGAAHRAAPDRAARGLPAPGARQRAGARGAVSRPADRRHQFLPRSHGIQGARRDGDPAPAERAGLARAASRVGLRLLHR